MNKNLARCGNFTSGEIVALTKEGKVKGTWGKPALTYIEETNMERRLGRSLSDEVTAKAFTWGNLCEGYWFDQLGIEYILSSTETDVHPLIPFWAGSKDGIKMDKGRTVIDIKSPITLKSFCQLVQPLYDGLTGMHAMNVIRDTHQDGEKYYQQLVSNSIISDTQFAELIVGMPYESEIPEIKLRAQSVPQDQLSKHYWIAMALNDELPFIPDGGYYKNLNVVRFEVPKEDKELLTAKVLKAGTMLINQDAKYSTLIVEADPSVNATIVSEAIPFPSVPITKLRKISK